MTARMTIAAALLCAVAAHAPALGADAAPVAALKAGKGHFEQGCRGCHGLDRALAPPREASRWEQIVKRMVMYGAPLDAAQRPLVVRYLAARSLFAQRCAGCHDLTRVVGDAPGRRDWKAIAGRMAGHAQEAAAKGGGSAGAPPTPEEAAEIAALLEATIP